MIDAILTASTGNDVRAIIDNELFDTKPYLNRGFFKDKNTDNEYVALRL